MTNRKSELKNVPRRSITEALSTKKIEFLKAPLVSPETGAVKIETDEPSPKPKKIKGHGSTNDSGKQVQLMPGSDRSVNAEKWVPLSTRVPNGLHRKLKRTAFERQESGVEPNSIQDILVEAVDHWLTRNPT